MFNYKDERVTAYATTAVQLETLNAYREHGTINKAAEALGKTPNSVNQTLYQLQQKFNKSETVNHDVSVGDSVPVGYEIKGVSSMVRNAEGLPIWIKTRKGDMVEAAKSAIDEYCKALPKIKSKKPHGLKSFDTDVIPWFNIGDGHLGMLSYHNEVNESFDLDIAEQDLCAAMGVLIDEAPTCERCVVQDMGDMTHYENVAGVTDASGHDLDCDGRFPKMIMTYVRVMRFIMDKALAKFKFVDVIINQGNHSRTNDFWMRTLLFNLYENDDRVNILDNQNIFIPYRMGNVFVMTHHSDKCRPKKLADVMTTDYRQDFGETEYHYIDIGHIHHGMQLKEHPGVTIESFNQIATKDAYAHEGGWRSRSCLTVVYRSKTYGEVGRQKISLERVRDILQDVQAGTNAQIRKKVYSV